MGCSPASAVMKCLLGVLAIVVLAGNQPNAQGRPGTSIAPPPGSGPTVQEVDPDIRRDPDFDINLAYQENVQISISQLEVGDFPIVRAFVSVIDQGGYVLGTLSPQHFTVTENGVEAQEVRFADRDALNLPFHIVFVVDVSGSMGVEVDSQGTTALDLEVEAIRQFVGQLNPRDKVALITFSDAPVREVPLTDDHQRLLRRLDQLSAFGQTTLWDATYRGMQELFDDDAPARRAMIVLSDGEDNNSLETPQDVLVLYETETKADKQGFTVYCLGLGPRINRQGLGNIANRTGGLYMDSPTAADLDDVYNDILNRIQKEYLLEYDAPTESKPGDIIDVEIGLKAVKSFTPGTYSYRSPGLSKALARALWPGILLILALLVALILVTIFKLNRRVWVTVMVTPLEGKDYLLGDLGANIGTSEVCEIRLGSDPAILPLHASIQETSAGFVVEAADPLSPILANGEHLVRKLLRSGDRFKLGGTMLVFNERTERFGDSNSQLASDLVDSRPTGLTEEDQLGATTGELPVKLVPTKLVGVSGPLATKVFALVKGENIAGRDGGLAISLAADNQVSRKHCVFQVSADTVGLMDTGSTNGTLLNGKLCQQGLAQTVYVGDTVKIGSSEYRLE